MTSLFYLVIITINQISFQCIEAIISPGSYEYLQIDLEEGNRKEYFISRKTSRSKLNKK